VEGTGPSLSGRLRGGGNAEVKVEGPFNEEGAPRG